MYFTKAGPVPAVTPPTGAGSPTAPRDVGSSWPTISPVKPPAPRARCCVSAAVTTSQPRVVARQRSTHLPRARDGSQGVWRRHPTATERSSSLPATKVTPGVSDTLAVSRTQVASPQTPRNLASSPSRSPPRRSLAGPPSTRRACGRRQRRPSGMGTGRPTLRLRSRRLWGASSRQSSPPQHAEHRDLPVRGEHPTFSPDGRSLAYANPDSPRIRTTTSASSTSPPGRRGGSERRPDLRELGNVWDLVWLEPW